MGLGRLVALAVLGGSLGATLGCGEDAAPLAKKGAGNTGTGGQGSGGSAGSGSTSQGRGYGFVHLTRTPYDQTASGSFIAAFYGDIDDRTPGVITTKTTNGPCVTSVATGTPKGLGASISAGDVTLRGGSQDITLQLVNKIFYAPKKGPDDRLVITPGDQLQLTATGDVVPAFDESFVVPLGVRLAAPLVSQNAEPSLDVTVAEGLTLDFPASASTGQLRVELSAKSSPSVFTTVSCLFDTSERSGFVSPEVLAALPLGPVELYVDTVVTRTVQAGAFAIDVVVSVPVLVPSGSTVPTDVTLK